MAIINNNVENVKFLRNQNPFVNREAARQALENNKGQAADGTALLARYTVSDGQTTDVKTLVGFVAEVNSTKYVTIIDVEGGSQDVEKLRQEINAKLGDGVGSGASETVTAQLTALSGNTASTSAETSVEGAKAYAYDLIGTLDYTDTAETGYYVSKVDEADGVINVTREALPTVSAISEAGKPITAVSESLGTISASAGTIDAQYVTATGFTATDVQGALEEIENDYKAAISGLDYTDTAVTGSYVSKVDEVDGVISVTREALPSVPDAAVNMKFVTAVAEDKGQITVSRGEITSSNKTISLSANTDGGIDFKANVDGTTIIIDENTGTMSVASSALVQYEGDDNTIQISAVSQGIRTVSSPLTIQKVTTSLSTNVLEEYHLVGASGTTIGDPVKIYKDSALVNFYLGHVDDKLTDEDPDTHESPTTAITNGSGDTALVWVMQLADGNYKLSAVNVESFLQEAEFASGVTADSSTHIVHGVVDSTSEKDSQSTPVDFLTVGADGFKISGIKDEIDRKINALDATGGTQTIATDKHVAVEVIEANGLITAVTVTEGNIADADDLAALSAKTITDVKSANGSVTVTPANAADGTKEIDLATDADKILMSGFSADNTSALSGIAESDSIATAFEKTNTVITENERVTAAALTDLDDRIETVSGDVEALSAKTITSVTVNNNAVTVANGVAPISITATSTEAITVNTDANGNITLGISSIDCGYYSE